MRVANHEDILVARKQRLVCEARRKAGIQPEGKYTAEASVSRAEKSA